MAKKITALKAQKKNSDRVSVFLDGEYAFGLFRVVAAWLQVGQEIDEEKIRQLNQTEAGEKAYQRALNFLSYRVRTETEIRRNLNKHDTPESVIEEVLERLRRNNLVDDLHFASTWVENRSEFRPRGRRALQSELRQKGVEQEVIEEALENLDEEELAYRAAKKNARKYLRFEWPEFRKKLLAFLARRGFNYGVAAPVVEQVWAEEQEQA
ncbi:MAG: RecX family transcriptional regulator [Anaerolineales bacterium]|nr:RecX family transcriptional regulator [Chloroflexota bacterium]MBL6983372.1 RecX family transcriptional regulator [Anaerolineales bacterium]